MRISRSGIVSIVSNLAALALTTACWFGLRIPMFLPYTWHKILHIFGVIMMVGNVTVGPLWVIVAWRSRDAGLLRFAMQTLALADIWFTAPGVQLALINGLAMSSVFGGLRAQPWLAQSYMLLVALTILSPTTVLYCQERAVRIAEERDNGPRFTRALSMWSIWGTAIMVPIMMIFYLMVSKQRIW